MQDRRIDSWSGVPRLLSIFALRVLYFAATLFAGWNYGVAWVFDVPSFPEFGSAIFVSLFVWAWLWVLRIFVKGCR